MAPRRLRVENASRRANSKHTAQPNFPGCGIDRGFNEMRAERGLLLLFGKFTVFDCVLGNQTLITSRLAGVQAWSCVQRLEPLLPCQRLGCECATGHIEDCDG
nr:hypothetical protein [Oligoflexus tunisiensis]